MFEGWGTSPGEFLSKTKRHFMYLFSSPKAREREVAKFAGNRHRGAEWKTHVTTAVSRKLKSKSNGSKKRYMRNIIL